MVNKINLIIDQFKIDKKFKVKLTKICLELSAYLVLSKEELLKLSKKEIHNKKFKFRKIIEGYEYLKSNSEFRNFLRINKEDVNKKINSIERYRQKLKEVRAGKIKPFQREINQVFNFLKFEVKMPLNDQIDFLHSLCIAFKYDTFGQKHLDQDYCDSKDMNAFKREEKDIIEKWQKDSEFDFNSYTS